ncbi:DUF2953 domain-containing protein [Butyrivibrio sp. MC2021]|uniref:DUF2953 domain-containing protein n=1 Tax=Butyrivibrio sp. MC2021 TaxID=1408306 RepID=UPI00047A9E86|nr:DUF2953 domain-containing protein [Butyrivibrio sp. MC2021]
MLAGVLGVLKIIGIVLLVILAVLLLLLALILFVPVRYKANLYIPETEFDKGFDTEKIQFSARYSWLFHIISGGIDFPDNKEFYAKVFGIKVFPRKQNPEKENADKKSEESAEEENTENTEKEESGVIEMSDMQELENNQPAEEAPQDDTSSQENDTSDSMEVEEEEEEGKALIEIIQDIIEKIENILKTPQDVFEKTQYTISRVCGKIKMIKTTLESEIFKRAYAQVKGRLIKVIKMILPDKYKAEILYGLGDPATTAEVMAAFGIIYPLTMDNVIVEPDFERQVVMVRARVKGHVTVFTILYSVLICYLKKDVMKVIRRFKKILST